MNSIRTRLLAGISALVVVAGATAGMLTYSWTFNEALELQDATLWQVSAIAIAVHPDRLPLADGNPEADTRVSIEELGAQGEAAVRAHGLSPLSPSLGDGLQNAHRGPDAWRVLIRTREDGSRVAVGQSVKARDEIAGGSAIRSMIPVAALMICLVILVGAITRYSFRPVLRLSMKLDESQAGPKERLPAEGIPSELLPFVASINGLLERIDRVFDQQSQFIANAAHELRTPIAALSLQIDNLGAGDASDREQRLKSAKAGVQRTARLIDQLLALARVETFLKDPHVPRHSGSLTDAAKEVVAHFSADAAEKSIDLGFGQVSAVNVAVDPTALRMVVRNLIENAVRHTPTNGSIDVVVRHDPPSAVLEIKDSGPGIAPGDFAEIFQPFVRGSNAIGNGSGLGLAIVKTIVDRYEGQLSAENGQPPLKGLCISIRFRAE